MKLSGEQTKEEQIEALRAYLELTAEFLHDELKRHGGVNHGGRFRDCEAGVCREAKELLEDKP